MKKTNNLNLNQYKSLVLFLVFGITISVLVFIKFLYGEIDVARERFEMRSKIHFIELEHQIQNTEISWLELRDIVNSNFQRDSRGNVFSSHLDLSKFESMFSQICIIERESKKVYLRSNGNNECGSIKLKDSAVRVALRFFEKRQDKYFLHIQKTLSSGLVLLAYKDVTSWFPKSDFFNLCLIEDDEIMACNYNAQAKTLNKQVYKNASYHFESESRFINGKAAIFYYPTAESMTEGISAQPFIMFGLCLLITFGICYVLFRMTIQKVNLQKSLRQERRTFESLNQRSLEVERFVTLMSHDLRTPLSGIASLVDFIEEDEVETLSPETKQNIQLIKERVDLIYRMVEVVSQYAKLSEKTFKTDNIDLLQEKIFSQYEKVVKKKLLLNTQLNFTGEFQAIKGDLTYFNKAIHNILDNALTYNMNSHRELTITGKISGYSQKITISDNGIGIHEKDFNRVFEMFRVLKNKQNIPSGVGAGLSFVKKIIDLHNGAISIDSSPGQGTKVILTFPLAKKVLK